MSEQTFDELDQKKAQPGALLDHLIGTLREEKKYHDLFDAFLLKYRHEHNLPLARPTSFTDVPPERATEFEEAYVKAAKEVGGYFLGDGDIAKAWMYLKPVKESQKVAEAIEALHPSRADDELVDIAFFQGVAPVRGLRMMLATHGTCSTITSFDQNFGNLPAEQRKKCAAVLVSELYKQLRDSVQHEVQRRQPMATPGQTLKELIAGKDELFADDNYHIDVSHLNAVVRFARTLEPVDPELKLALQLAQYGSKLAEQYRYAGSPPFEDFYAAHIEYFQVLLNTNREEGLAYFRDKLGPDVDDQQNQLTAYVLVDLLQRIGKPAEALEIACKYLSKNAEDFGFSLAEMCATAGRNDLYQKIAKEQGDLIGYASALLTPPKAAS